MTSISPVDDHYTGSVAGPHQPQRRTTANATITKMSVGPMDNNVYVLTCTQTGDQLLIDAANDAPAILALLEELPGTLRAILTTHGHPDHWQALAEVLFDSAFNRSSEHHEGSSWFAESKHLDDRISTIEKWDAATKTDAMFVLAAPRTYAMARPTIAAALTAWCANRTSSSRFVE